MINLYAGRDTTPAGQLTDEQLQFLIDNLEEEWEGDQDYYLDGPTLDFLAAREADAGLLALLRAALGEKESGTVRWDRG
jgi:hypothetical protein